MVYSMPEACKAFERACKSDSVPMQTTQKCVVSYTYSTGVINILNIQNVSGSI